MTTLKKTVANQSGENSFKCTHCRESFCLKIDLDVHLQEHSSLRPFGCSKCTRTFSNKKDLQRHEVVHSADRPFKCRICQTAFRRKDNLDRHIQNTHSQSKEMAKKLADRAAADYLNKRQTNLDRICCQSRLTYPTPSKRTAMDDIYHPGYKNLPDAMGVVITAELSPPLSPNVNEIDANDDEVHKEYVFTATIQKNHTGKTNDEANIPDTDDDDDRQYFQHIS